jgi:MAP3K TRAFs-binding domain
MQLCFVLMPFGVKTGPDGKTINFDKVYERLIRPSIAAAGLEPLRADHEEAGGFIQKPMFEALLLCEFAVADLTFANPNVFYELGIRHAVRPWSTIPIMADGGRLPIDVDALKTVFYKIGADGLPDAESIQAASGVISAMLVSAKTGIVKDSPIYQLLDYYSPPRLDHEKADIFRDQVKYSREMKEKLADARSCKEGALEALKDVEAELGDVANAESGVVVDLMLSYRSKKAFQEMIDLVAKMALPLQGTVMVQEQFALALNRVDKSDRAERVLLDLIEKRGPSSETYGLLGRIYKDRWTVEMDRWREAHQTGVNYLANGILDQGIAAYLKGFEADWRDAYPGINAVTLMELHEPPDPRRLEIIPVVRYSVTRRIAKGVPDYWDHATLLELDFLAADQQAAFAALGNAVAAIKENDTFQPTTTANNLSLILEARERRGQSEPWMATIVEELRKRAEPKETVAG